MQNRVRSGDFRQNLTGKREHMKIIDMNWPGDYVIQHCDIHFSISVNDFEATCPICGQTIKVASLRRDWESK